MKTFFKKLSVLFYILIFVNVANAQAILFHDGDIVGESNIAISPTTAFFEAATGTRFGHVAIVLHVKGDWVVYEETPPKAQVVALYEFLNHSPGPFSVIRSKVPLQQSELDTIKAAAQDLVDRGIPYNHAQTHHEGFLNCSEFTRTVFSKAGINVGKDERVQEMNLATFHGYPWMLWKHLYPDTNLEDQVTTPASVMQSPGWYHADGPLDPLKQYSDLELVENWKNEHALEDVATLWKITPEELEKLAQPSQR